MNRKTIPDPRELIIVRGTNKNYSFVSVGLIRMLKDRYYFVANTGAKICWSNVTKWDYLKDVAPDYDIWAPVKEPDPLVGISYPYQHAENGHAD